MKAVLISIQPKWCELIASGKKTVEVRKTKPKLETPFKVYIYCTNGDSLNYLRLSYFDNYQKFWVDNKDFGANVARANGKVIGEFVCDRFIESFLNNNDGWFVEKGCLTQEEIDEYQGDKPILYGWHISDLVIYDKPKELNEFRTPCKMTEGSCYFCDYAVHGMDGDLIDCNTSLTRPPQSWCYVEEVGQ